MPTTPRGIWTPDDSDDWDLTVDLAATAVSVDTALTVVANGGVPSVPNAAARDAIFTSPVQGNRVFRSDLGYEEVYMGAYNATTNPSGIAVPGWTRLGPSAHFFGWQNGGTWTVPITSYSGTGYTDVAYNAGIITIRKPGLYSIGAQAKQTNSPSGQSLLLIKNGVIVAYSPNAANVNAPYTGAFLTESLWTLVPGDTLQLSVSAPIPLQLDTAPAINSYFKILQVR